MKKTLFEDALILNAIRLARFCVRSLPLSVCLVLAKGVGTVSYAVSKRRRVAYKNLRMVFAGQKSPRELKRLALRSFQNLAMSGMEMLRIPEMSRSDVDKYFTIEGKENFEPYVRSGQGIIFLTGHFGSWELLNIVGGLLGYPMVALARIQKHPRSDAYLNSLRVSKGSQVIHKGMPVREILRALKRGKIVGILSDQDGGKNGRFVDFFGRSSSSPSGAATFSIRTGSPIFPSFIVREKGARHRIIIEPAIPAPEASLTAEAAEGHILQKFADALERQVRRHPEQWLWAHRRWKSSPDRRVVILSDGKAGHLQQSRAMFEAMRRERLAQGFDPGRLFSETLEVRFRSDLRKKIWKALGLLFRGCPPFSGFWLGWALTSQSARALRDTYADIVISCGSSLLELNLWMKKENSAKSLAVMKPDISLRAFDAVVAPRHDHLKAADNVFVTEGALSGLRPEDLRLEAERLKEEYRMPDEVRCIGLLVGGDTAESKFDPALFEKTMLELRRFCEVSGVKALLTTSRRTPVWAESLLKEIFSSADLCPVRIIANEANRPGIVAGILGVCGTVLVSGESMSMVSEAVSAGKPVLVFNPCRDLHPKKKYSELLKQWESEQRVSLCASEGLVEALTRSMAGPADAGADGDEAMEKVLSEAARRVF